MFWLRCIHDLADRNGLLLQGEPFIANAISHSPSGKVGDGRESGLGLGLPIVKAFVEAHGGQVNVDSQPGDGSCFRFTLPAGSP